MNSDRPLHLFFVQSYISYLVCRAIIRHEGLEASDVAFILDRKLQAETDFRTAEAPTSFASPIRKSWRGIADNLRKRARAKAFLNEVIGGRPFIYYTNRMNQVALNHVRRIPGLCAVNLYEEGYGAYWRKLTAASDAVREEGSLRERLIYKLSLAPWPLRGAFTLDSYARAFVTCERAFPGFPRRTIVDLHTVLAEEAGRDRFDHVPYGATVFALPLPYRYLDDEGLTRRLIDALCLAIEASRGPCLFKFHPDRYDHSTFWNAVRDRVLDRTGCDITKQIVPDLLIEAFALARDDAVIAVVSSSITVYADHYRARTLAFVLVVLGDRFPTLDTYIASSPATIFVEPGDDAAAVAARLNAAPAKTDHSRENEETP